jgi:methylenetetrahydrofolate reductase (NADPH)
MGITTVSDHAQDTRPAAQRFRQAVRDRQFLITAEVMPPKGGDPSHMVAMAAGLRGRVHAVNITDGSRAVMRMSSLASAVILQQQGIESICQMACRDRNRIALQADLMGAHALGIRNILALTGDPVKAGDHADARPVFDLESVRLLQTIRQLNHGVGHLRSPPDGPPHRPVCGGGGGSPEQELVGSEAAI